MQISPPPSPVFPLETPPLPPAGAAITSSSSAYKSMSPSAILRTPTLTAAPSPSISFLDSELPDVVLKIALVPNINESLLSFLNFTFYRSHLALINKKEETKTN
ncbi:hypothetical protein V1477_013591 [Vespula maculifrons]|uniref:Uncharacterized protein n=1 Tax=Vespula maculifrons TaxID=7453 RepID=A0ABD2BQ17_VESMC